MLGIRLAPSPQFGEKAGVRGRRIRETGVRPGSASELATMSEVLSPASSEMHLTLRQSAWPKRSRSRLATRGGTNLEMSPPWRATSLIVEDER